MMGWWNSAEGAKRLALVLMTVALAAIALVLFAGQKKVAIQGPGTLGVTSAGTLWVVVDDAVWALDAQGRRVQEKSIEELGLADPPSNMVALPDGNMLLAERGDEDWQVVNPRTFAKVRTLRMQWPEEFKRNARALHVAVSPAGRFAAATGGGHAVLLFDADGRFLKRTAPDTYYFTNGLWHADEGWWTTDTNRTRLVLLDDDTLAVKRAIETARAPAGYWALGEFVRWGGPGGTADAPIATVTRLGELMEVGHVADVYADGKQAIYKTGRLKLRDIAWFDGQLVAVDGGAFRLLLFGADRSPRGEFGDAQVRSLLGELHERREFWTTLSSRWAFAPALLLLVAGVVAHARHKKLQLEPPPVQQPEPKPARAWRDAIASFILPGAGQWLQGRFGMGTALFAAGLVAAVFVWGPILLLAIGPKTHVGFALKQLAVASWLIVSLLAAGDALRFSSERD